jgi:hypothetical protein
MRYEIVHKKYEAFMPCAKPMKHDSIQLNFITYFLNQIVYPVNPSSKIIVFIHAPLNIG